MTSTIYLKFPSKDIFESLMEDAGLTTINSEGEKILSLCSHERSIDIIGIIYEGEEWSTDIETGEPTEIHPPVPLEGYHINISGNVPDEFRDYIISSPSTPYRIFF